jgi:hypothetical protein
VVTVRNISLKLCSLVFIFYNYREIKINVLRGCTLADYINKNGLPVGTGTKELFEELMRGTGFVMGPKASLFLENSGLHDKNIVVSRMLGPENTAETQMFSVNQFQGAVDLFNSWSLKD